MRGSATSHRLPRRLSPKRCERAAATALGTVLLQAAATAMAGCPVVDATVTLVRVARSSAGRSEAEQLAAYRHGVIDRWPGLYTEAVLGLSAGPLMDKQILRSLEAVRRDGDHPDLRKQLRTHLTATRAAFGVFGDFKCNFPIYFADTLGALDGAGRIIEGKRVLVLGIGSLAREESQISLPVFLTHEFFHRYHFEAAGFSDDLEDRQEIWRNLWAEGLATYVSEVLTPGATTADALMIPRDLEQRAEPLTSRMSSELLAGLDGMDEELFNRYFTTNPKTDRHGIPPRAGYYVGYVVARQLAARHTLAELAHLQGEALHSAITATLRELAADYAPPPPTAP